MKLSPLNFVVILVSMVKFLVVFTLNCSLSAQYDRSSPVTGVHSSSGKAYMWKGFCAFHLSTSSVLFESPRSYVMNNADSLSVSTMYRNGSVAL